MLACVSLAVGRNISLEGDVEGLVQPVPLSGDDCVTHILYPHLLFEFLAVNHRRQFLQYMASTQRELADFWEGLLRSPYGVRLRAHPHIRGLNIEDLSLCIPLTVHGDAAPYGKRRSTLLVQWGPVLGTVGLHVHEHGSGSVRWLRVHNQHENKSGRGGGRGEGRGCELGSPELGAFWTRLEDTCAHQVAAPNVVAACLLSRMPSTLDRRCSPNRLGNICFGRYLRWQKVQVNT